LINSMHSQIRLLLKLFAHLLNVPNFDLTFYSTHSHSSDIWRYWKYYGRWSICSSGANALFELFVLIFSK